MYTLQGKTRPTHHTHSTLGPRMALDHTYLTWFACSNILWVINSVGWILPLPRKSAPDSTSQPCWVARGTRINFSPNPTIEVVGLSQASIDGKLLGLLGPFHQHATCMFNTCSRGANPSVLNQHRRGLQFWRCRLTTSHSSTFPTIGLPFPPKGPTRSQVINQLITIRTKSHEWEPPLDSTVTYHLSIAWANIVPQR
jgi:hypothetical protein